MAVIALTPDETNPNSLKFKVTASEAIGKTFTVVITATLGKT